MVDSLKCPDSPVTLRAQAATGKASSNPISHEVHPWQGKLREMMKEGKQKFLIFLYPLPPLKRLEDQKFLDEVRTGQPPSSQGVEKQLDALHRVLVEKPLRDPKIIKSAQEAKAQVDEIIKGIIASSGLSKKEIGAIDYKLMLAEKPAGTPDGAKVLWNAEERYSITIAEHADGSWGAPGPNEMKCWQAAR